MLGGQAHPSIAMYHAIRNSQTQMDVLDAAAKVALSPENLQVFAPLLVVIKRASTGRHKVAHWLWGDTDAFPDCLILVDPDGMREYDKAMSDHVANLERGIIPPDYPKLDNKFAFIWKETDFIELIAELNDLYHLALLFSALISFGGKVSVSDDDALRVHLLNQPRIRKVLQS
jgi:hypothetical protein